MPTLPPTTTNPLFYATSIFNRASVRCSGATSPVAAVLLAEGEMLCRIAVLLSGTSIDRIVEALGEIATACAGEGSPEFTAWLSTVSTSAADEVETLKDFLETHLARQGEALTSAAIAEDAIMKASRHG